MEPPLQTYTQTPPPRPNGSPCIHPRFQIVPIGPAAEQYGCHRRILREPATVQARAPAHMWRNPVARHRRRFPASEAIPGAVSDDNIIIYCNFSDFDFPSRNAIGGIRKNESPGTTLLSTRNSGVSRSQRRCMHVSRGGGARIRTMGAGWRRPLGQRWPPGTPPGRGVLRCASDPWGGGMGLEDA